MEHGTRNTHYVVVVYTMEETPQGTLITSQKGADALPPLLSLSGWQYTFTQTISRYHNNEHNRI